MAVALEQFVKNLTDSGVLSAGKLEHFLPPKAHPKDAQELARQLVQSKQLTKYQAQEIYQGRAKSLILGSYTILDKIGAGGMGQVFKAQHRRMDRIVAIKMLPRSVMRDAATVARFEREVRAAAKLEHPNIVTAYDADEAVGVHFLVMQYVEGSDLSALVKKDGPLSVGKALNFVLQAARGLEYAHKNGVVHRDIKPANLLLNSEGAVKILDMGLARISGDGNSATQAELTGTGAVMGTVDYMAPEQALSTKHADGRADIYSLGCTLYYLLTGQPIYDGETLTAKLIAHQSQAVPELRAIRAETPAELDAVFQKMAAKKIDDRYQTMSEVVADLENCTATQLASSVVRPSVAPKSGGDTAGRLDSVTSAIALSSGPKPAEKSQSAPLGKRGGKNRVLIVSGGAAALVAMLAVILAFGRRTADPDGGKAGSPPVASNQIDTPGPPGPAIAPFSAAQARKYQEAWASHLGTQVETTNSIGMKMVLIPPGEFLMGSTDAEVETAIAASIERNEQEWARKRMRDAERPQHHVVLSRPLAVGGTEVTVAQFRQFVDQKKHTTLAEKFGGDSDGTDDSNPGKRERTWRSPAYSLADDLPVTEVAWDDAVAFCNWLSQKEKLSPAFRHAAQAGWNLVRDAVGYRLPTEAEWEYVCRAGTTTQYSFGDQASRLPEYGWFNDNAGGSPHAVGSKPANPFGLCDVHGNVEEWCADWLDEHWYATSPERDPQGPGSGLRRVIRGGYWFYDASSCRSASRNGDMGPALRTNFIGFRVVRSLPLTAEASGTGSSLAADTAKASDTAPKDDASQPTPPIAKAPFDAKRARAHQEAWANHLDLPVEYIDSIGMKFALIPPGEYQMGTSDEELPKLLQMVVRQGEGWESPAFATEMPRHLVRITRPYYLGEYEVTNAQFEQFAAAANVAGWKPWEGGADAEMPVGNTTYEQMTEFCEWLSAREQSKYRLPTEAEWEYACRAGTTTPFAFGNSLSSTQANFNGEFPFGDGQKGPNRFAPTKVGTFAPNAWGLYDMHGNVWEICSDWHAADAYEHHDADDPTGPATGTMHVNRGGDFEHSRGFTVRSATRLPYTPPYFSLGFRVVREIPSATSKAVGVAPPPAKARFDAKQARAH